MRRNVTIDQRFADLAAAAKFVGYSKRQLYELVRTGSIPAYRLLGGGKLLVDLAELCALLQKHDGGTLSREGRSR